MDSGDLARYFGVDAGRMLDAMDEDMIKIEPEGRGDLLAAYVCDMEVPARSPGILRSGDTRYNLEQQKTRAAGRFGTRLA